jgi:hypothetical protein
MSSASRRALLGVFGLGLLSAGLCATPVGSWLGSAWAQEEEPAKVTVKGQLQGGSHLLNPVWEEAKDPKRHRYTFRAPSATVSQDAKRLTAYLPKELCIVALGDGATPKSQPVQVHVSGGRTTPTTVVIAEGQNVQFVNDDPFPHRLYDASGTQGGMAVEETRPTAQRIWKPPAVGVYEIRDKNFPSIRSWIVVEKRAVSFAHPKATAPNEFLVPDLPPGAYELQAYFMGKPTGKPLKIDVRPTPALQPIPAPLVVAEKKTKKNDE